ncbi:hypothetical protein HAX54_022615, partial [Datura stramonium]|nr:hypothetical protein [Datura stramonium]
MLNWLARIQKEKYEVTTQIPANQLALHELAPAFIAGGSQVNLQAIHELTPAIRGLAPAVRRLASAVPAGWHWL